MIALILHLVSTICDIAFVAIVWCCLLELRRIKVLTAWTKAETMRKQLPPPRRQPMERPTPFYRGTLRSGTTNYGYLDDEP